MASHPLLVGQPAHSTRGNQLPGLAKRTGAARWASVTAVVSNMWSRHPGVLKGPQQNEKYNYFTLVCISYRSHITFVITRILKYYHERNVNLSMLIYPEGFFVSGLNLTAPRQYIARHPNQSLRTLSMSNWESLREWLEKQIPGAHSDSLNIIAGDFVGPCPFCPLVISLNKRLLQKKTANQIWEHC